jgi:hypothetical protein
MAITVSNKDNGGGDVVCSVDGGDSASVAEAWKATFMEFKELLRSTGSTAAPRSNTGNTVVVIA